MATINTSYRCTEKERKAIERRAEKLKIGVSTLLSRVISFFGEIEMCSSFWDDLPAEAKRRGVTSDVLMVELLMWAKMEKPPFRSFEKPVEEAKVWYSPATDQI